MVRSKGSKNWFQQNIKENMKDATKPGFTRGKVIVKNALKGPTPSTQYVKKSFLKAGWLGGLRCLA
jgi:hypothetical protein